MLPEEMLKKITDHYLEKREYHKFERIILQLNFKYYYNTPELEKICKEKILLTGLLHLIVTTYETKNEVACAKILEAVYSTFQ